MSNKIEIYTDGACSGNPGLFRPKQQSCCVGAIGSRDICRFEPNDSAPKYGVEVIVYV